MYNTDMSYQVTLYHGSGNIVRVPEYGYGKANNEALHVFLGDLYFTEGMEKY